MPHNTLQSTLDIVRSMGTVRMADRIYIYNGWVGNWALVGYVNRGSYNVSYARIRLCTISS